MKFRTFLAGAAAMAVAALLPAQTKISGTAQCGKPDPQHVIEVGDKPGHSMSVGKGTCTWTKPLEMAGLKTKDGQSVFTSDMSGNKSTERGIHVATMDNGDKAYIRFQGTTTLKDGAPQTDTGTWSYTGGTGKLKGLKGKGTFKGKANPDGFTYEIEGDYELPK